MAITIDGTNGLSSDNAALKLDGTTLAVDETNNRVGVGTASPAVAMDVVGQVRASTGILFGSDTAAANALDDYEEGTWTPSVTASGGGATSGGTFSGTYIKIGRVVHAWGQCTGVGKNTLSGGIYIAGFPFSVSASSKNPNAVLRWGGFPSGSGSIAYVPQSGGGTSFEIQKFSTSGYQGALLASELSSTFDLYNVTVSFLTD